MVGFYNKPRFRKRKGGVSRIVRDTYGTARSWYEMVKNILERDNHECKHATRTEDGIKVCRSKDDLEVHHINPLSKGGKTVDTNLITLCKTHHGHRHPGLDNRRKRE